MSQLSTVHYCFRSVVLSCVLFCWARVKNSHPMVQKNHLLLKFQVQKTRIPMIWNKQRGTGAEEKALGSRCVVLVVSRVDSSRSRTTICLSQALLKRQGTRDTKEDPRNRQDDRIMKAIAPQHKRSKRYPLSSFKTDFRKPSKESDIMKLRTRMVTPCGPTSLAF